MSHAKLPRILVPAAVVFTAVSLFAGIWFGHKSGVASLVVKPRQYVPVPPASTQQFSALAYWGDETTEDISSNGTAWLCSESIGHMIGESLAVTGGESVIGWVQGSFSGLTKRVYVKITNEGQWNPDADTDHDGYSDYNEFSSNTPPDQVTLMRVRCQVY